MDTDYEGNRMVREVLTWCDARRMLRDELGVEVAEAKVEPIVKEDWYTGLPVSKGWIHCHFFGKDGREVAYWTTGLNNLFVFKSPRAWDSAMFAAAESLL
jgi:hypothetical protein